MIINLVRELHVRLQASLAEALQGVSLTLDEYYALRVLKESPAPIKMSTLGARLLRDPSAATRVVDVLERRGLCRRMLTPNDRRARFVSINENGRHILARAEVVAQGVETGAIEPLTNTNVVDLRRLLLRLIDDPPGGANG